MNLSTARSEKRAKEVGIRKVVGAQKKALDRTISRRVNTACIYRRVLAMIMVQASLAGFNTLTNKKLFVDYGNISYWLFGLGFVLFTGIVAGSYPAFFLSSFQPVRVLKGLIRSSKALVTPRKVLVVLQFTFAIILIISTIVVKHQIDYARSRETGYDKNNLVYHFLTGDLEKNYDLVKQDLLAAGIATNVTKTSAPLTQGWSDSWDFVWEGKAPDDKTDFDRFCADDNIVATGGMQLTQGRDLNLKQYPTDSEAIILNESAVKAMNFKNPLGQIVKDNGVNWHVVGVIKDFILQSPYQPLKPMVIEGAKGWFNTMHIRLNGRIPLSEILKRQK